MSSNIRNCVRNIEKKENVSELLPVYVKEYMILHDHYARINLMMEYYMFYETVSEGINPYIDSARDTAEAFHGLLARFLKKPEGQEVARMAEELLELRAEVVDKMQVLTNYVDCYVVYEYILNRVQYRFEDREMMPGDEVFARDLVNFIFASDDNAIISENIRFAVGQLPMRMTRSRYFGLLRDNISVYQGSDVSSLEGFLYMFRTNAMLYQDENREKYFTEFAPVLEELAELDFENISKETYMIYAEKIRINASKLNDVADLYMQLGEMINELYTMCVTERYAGEEHFLTETDTVIRGINAMFLKQDTDVWERAGSEKTDTEEEKLSWLGEQFVAVEGKQEQLFENLNTAGAALEGIQESYQHVIETEGLSEDFSILRRLFLITSNSVFAELEVIDKEEKVTGEMVERVTAELIEECKKLFQGKSRMLRRAVMANTLEKMPIFFNSAQEVADYVTNALASCDDEAEKYAAKQLLLEIME